MKKLTHAFVSAAALMLLGTAAAVANGTEPSAAPQPVATQPVPPGMPAAPVWVQLPVAGSYPYFLMVPQPVPSPVLPQMVLPPGWGPFVMVWVPVQALQAQSMPPVVDYGPVADTPVVVLPEPEAEPSASAGLSPSVPAAEATPSAVPETAGPPAEPPGLSVPAESAMPAEVDYGPVAPTPVVVLPAHAAPSAAPQADTKKPVKPRKKPVAGKKPVSPSAPPATAKKRMCWTNGVVAPCR